MVCLSLAGVFAGLGIFSSRRRKLDLLFALYMLVSGLSCLVFFVMDNIVPAGADVYGGSPGQMSPERMRTWTYRLNRANWILGLWFIAFQIHFVLRYCRYQNFLARRIWLLYVSVGLLSLLTLTPAFARPASEPIGAVGSWLNAVPWFPQMGPASHIYVLAWAGAQAYCLTLLIRRGRRLSRKADVSAGHIGWILAGFSFNAVLGTSDFLLGISGWTGTTVMPMALTACAGCLSVGLVLDLREVQSLREDLAALQMRAWSQREEERRNLARDLHDSLAQELAVLDLVLSTELMTTGRDKGQIGTAVQRAREMTRDLRHVCYGLFPPSLEAKGLTGAVEELLDYCRLTGIEAQLLADERMRGRRLASQAEEALLRIIQEAVSNASRHGQADRIEVVLRISGEHLVVEVRDNGIGFDAQAQAGGLGLRSMARRAESLNGVMEIKSQEGTVLRVIVRMQDIDTAGTGTAQTG